MTAEQYVRRVVIVGGGSAGWLTAGVLAADHMSHREGGLQVTLIESPDVKTIGVGEGTWPSMRDTLRRIGVSEAAFMRECDASFKQGSRFIGWVSGDSRDHYYHPFTLPMGFGDADLARHWSSKHAGSAFANRYCYQPKLCEFGRAPKQVTTPEYAAVANYAYHLDAGKFGEFLREHCVSNLGVHHVLDHVDGVSNWENGDIKALATRQHGPLAADLFVDCTGFGSLLLGRHYGIPLVDRSHQLFNDSALAVQVPYVEADAPIASQTDGTAQKAGWIWDIGLPTRRGVGYVYSSNHASDTEAEVDLRAYLGATGSLADLELRKISFRPGHRAKFWHRNCVAVGLSAGFVEPLEASALALIELSATMISDDMPVNRSLMDVVARRFNDRFAYRWNRIIDFLKLHYALSQRDEAYWRENRAAASMPTSLTEFIDLWRYQSPSQRDFTDGQEIFPAASYQYVLYGMGQQLESRPCSQYLDHSKADRYVEECSRITAKMLGALPDNRTLLSHIRQNGMPKL